MASEKGTVDEVEAEPDVHFEPLVSLEKVEVVTLEEQEEELLSLRAKLFRFDKSEPDSPQWKERGTGYIKLLKHKESGLIRILMRRDKTLKICANHYVQPSMDVKSSSGSDRAWVWATTADFTDDEPCPELLAARFQNAENAQQFKEKVEKAKEAMKIAVKNYINLDDEKPNSGSNEETTNGSPSSPDKSGDTKPETGAAGDSTQKDSKETETELSLSKEVEKLTVSEKYESETKEKPSDESETKTEDPPVQAESKE